MWKKYLIEIGIRIFISWLHKQTKDHPLIVDIKNVETHGDIIRMMEKESTKDAIADIVEVTALEPVGEFLDKTIRKIFKKLD